MSVCVCAYIEGSVTFISILNHIHSTGYVTTIMLISMYFFLICVIQFATKCGPGNVM
jgi:uncharacterized membrane protein (DUF485 family)